MEEQLSTYGFFEILLAALRRRARLRVELRNLHLRRLNLRDFNLGDLNLRRLRELRSRELN